MMRSPSWRDFETFLINEGVDWYDLKKDEDEFGLEYYLDIETDHACKMFTSGYLTGLDVGIQMMGDIDDQH